MRSNASRFQSLRLRLRAPGQPLATSPFGISSVYSVCISSNIKIAKMINLVHRRNDQYTKTAQQNFAKIGKNQNNFTLFPLTLPFG